MKNILLALELDNEKHTEELVAHALTLSKALQAKCWIIHVAPPHPDFVGYEVGPQYIRDELADELKGEHKTLHQIAQRFEATGIECQAILIQGPTEEMLLEEIGKHQIDLVIMGNRKQNLFREIFVGSVKDDILGNIDIPTVLIPLNDK
jgi:nucleotide-binding universal stress UspA family protein